MIKLERRIKNQLKHVKYDLNTRELIKYLNNIIVFESIFLNQTKINKKLAYRVINNIKKFDKNFVKKFEKQNIDNQYTKEVHNYINYFIKFINTNKVFLENYILETEKTIINALLDKNLSSSINLVNENMVDIIKKQKLILHTKNLKLSNRKMIYKLHQRIFFKVSPFANFTETSLLNKKINKQESLWELSLNFLYRVLDFEVLKRFEKQKLRFNDTMIQKDNNIWITGFVNQQTNLYKNNQITICIKDKKSKDILKYLNNKFQDRYFTIENSKYLSDNINFLKKLFEHGYIFYSKPNKPQKCLKKLFSISKNRIYLKILENINNQNFFELKINLHKIMLETKIKMEINKIVYIDSVYYNSNNKFNIKLNNNFIWLFNLFNDDVWLQKYLFLKWNKEDSKLSIKSNAKNFRDISQKVVDYYILNSGSTYGYFENFKINDKEMIELNEYRMNILNDICKFSNLTNSWLNDIKKNLNGKISNTSDYSLFGHLNDEEFILNHVYSGSTKYKNRFLKYFEKNSEICETNQLKNYDFPINLGFNANYRENFNLIKIPNCENIKGQINWYEIELLKKDNTIKTFYNGEEINIQFGGTLIPLVIPPIINVLSKLNNSGGMYFTFTELIIRKYYNENKNELKEITIFDTKKIANIVIHRKSFLITNLNIINKIKNLNSFNIMETWIEILLYFLQNKLPLQFYSLDIRVKFNENYQVKNKEKPIYIDLLNYPTSIFSLIISDENFIFIQENYPKNNKKEYIYELQR